MEQIENLIIKVSDEIYSFLFLKLWYKCIKKITMTICKNEIVT